MGKRVVMNGLVNTDQGQVAVRIAAEIPDEVVDSDGALDLVEIFGEEIMNKENWISDFTEFNDTDNPAFSPITDNVDWSYACWLLDGETVVPAE